MDALGCRLDPSDRKAGYQGNARAASGLHLRGYGWSRRNRRACRSQLVRLIRTQTAAARTNAQAAIAEKASDTQIA